MTIKLLPGMLILRYKDMRVWAVEKREGEGKDLKVFLYNPIDTENRDVLYHGEEAQTIGQFTVDAKEDGFDVGNLNYGSA